MTPDTIHDTQQPEKKIITGAIRRDPTPEGIANRALFERYTLLERTHKILELPEEELTAEDIADIDKLIPSHLQYLLNLDPGIPLELLRRQEEKKLQNPDYINEEISIATTKLSVPSIKELNDKYFGINRTNAFIADLHQETSQILSRLDSELISTHFKGEYILIRNTSSKNQEAIKKAIQTIEQEVAPRLLRKHAMEHIQYLKKSTEEKKILISLANHTISQDQQNSINQISKDINLDEINIQDQQKQIDQTENNIKLLEDNLIQNNAKVKIAFGSCNIESENNKRLSLKKLILSLLKSEINANQNKKETPDESSESMLNLFNTQDFFEGLLIEKINIIQALKDPENVKLREFFDLNMHPYLPTLKKEKISQLRKMEKYKETPEFQQNEKLILKYVIPSYLKTIDILKNLVREKYSLYEQYIKNCADVIASTTDKMDQNPSVPEKKQILTEMLPFLTKACKSTVSGIETGLTEEEFIRRVTHDKIVLFIFGDMKNFGAENIIDLGETENEMIDLYYPYMPKNLQNALHGNTIALSNISASPKNIKNALKNSIPEFEKSENFAEFNEAILGIGDKCTEKGNLLRDETTRQIPGVLNKIIASTITINTKKGPQFTIPAKLEQGYSIGSNGDEIIIAIPIEDQNIVSASTLDESDIIKMKSIHGAYAYYSKASNCRIVFYLRNPQNPMEAKSYLTLNQDAEKQWTWIKNQGEINFTAEISN